MGPIKLQTIMSVISVEMKKIQKLQASESVGGAGIFPRRASGLDTIKGKILELVRKPSCIGLLLVHRCFIGGHDR